MNGWLLAAAASTGAAAIFHCVAGGRSIAAPLLRAEGLDEEARLVLYFCWHLATIVMVAMALAFAAAAWRSDIGALAWATTALSLAFGAWGIALVVAFRVGPLRYPQGPIFLLIGGLGAIGSAG